MPFICQFRIYFVGYHNNILTGKHADYLFKVVTLHYGAGGIIRERDDHDFSSGRNSRCEQIRREPELILIGKLHYYGSSAAETRTAFIGDKAGFGDNDLITGTDQGA